jgi:serine/threonine protein kinase
MLPRRVGHYTLLAELGSGSFASVWLGEHTFGRCRVAIKVIDRSLLEDPALQIRFDKELAIFKRMNHPFIIKLFEEITTPTHIFLVQELAEGGSLFTLINEQDKLSEVLARRYFTQLIAALDYLHNELAIAHRDLKPENVLLDSHLNIRLIDFGLSQTFSRESPHLKTPCGSPAYVCPEIVRGQPYTQAADVWSAGILLYAMVIGELPFHDESVQKLLEKIISTEPNYPSTLSSALVDLLKRLLVKDPGHRITIEMIKQHPWVSGREYMQIFNMYFSSESNFLTSAVDSKIVEEIAALGGDVSGLQQALLRGESTDATALYMICQRRRIAERIHEGLSGKTNGQIMGSMSMKTPTREQLARPVPRAETRRIAPRHSMAPGATSQATKSPKPTFGD